MKKSIYMNDEKMAHIKYLFKIHKHSEALNEIDEYIIEYPNEYYAYVFKAMILLCDEKIIEVPYN